MFDIGYKCNLRCRFCYNCLEQFIQDFPDIELTKDILKILKNWGVKEILYLGGEPLLSPFFCDIISYGNQLCFKQRVVTNGTLIDVNWAKLFKKYQMEVGISIHGINSAAHDALTQRPGSFEKAVNAIKLLAYYDVSWFLQYTPTHGHANLLSIALWAHNSFNKKPAFIDINRLLPKGIGALEQDNIFPTEKEWWTVIKEIALVPIETNISVRVESVPYCWVFSHAKYDNLSKQDIQRILAAIRPCYMAINQIAIDPQGCLKICPGTSAFSPSILEVDPQEIWKNHPVLQNRRKLQFLPTCCIDYHKNKSCKYFYKCGGGCKMANNVQSNLAVGGPDPLILENI
jgi:radical SAM protein with 4Fe4S-binding SPASM domain